MADYAARELARGERLPSITRHMLGLYAGEPGAREFRRALSVGVHDPDATADLLRRVAPAAVSKAEAAATAEAAAIPAAM